MAEGNLLINLSVLNRNVQKFFDKSLAEFDIGSGQVLFLFFIYENEGITMQEASRMVDVDKGTTTKSIQKLIEEGYVQSRTDEKDRRIKRLYTTPKAFDIMTRLYDLRNDLRKKLGTETDLNQFEEQLAKICSNSREYLDRDEEDSVIRIGGLMKTSLLDYPEKVASTIFTAGCNFKCPFCRNKELVFLPDNYQYDDPQEILSFLEKRAGILDAVCITGGEPTLHKGLPDLIEKIREMGYLIKLDTNGYRPDDLIMLCETGMIDYVAMDIKNSPEKYAATVGLNEESFDIERIRRSVDYIMSSEIPCEFRTTVVREFHTEEDMEKIGEWLKGAQKFCLQQFTDSANVIQPGLNACTLEEILSFRKILGKYIPNVVIRGISED